jgi:hypothetical protein
VERFDAARGIDRRDAVERSLWAPNAHDKRKSFDEIRFIAKARGYTDGWRSYKFRDLRHWPNGVPMRGAEPVPPSLKTRNWVRSRQLAYADAHRHG